MWESACCGGRSGPHFLLLWRLPFEENIPFKESTGKVMEAEADSISSFSENLEVMSQWHIKSWCHWCQGFCLWLYSGVYMRSPKEYKSKYCTWQCPVCVYPKPISYQWLHCLSAFLTGCSNEALLLIFRLIFPRREDTIWSAVGSWNLGVLSWLYWCYINERWGLWKHFLMLEPQGKASKAEWENTIGKEAKENARDEIPG